MTIDAVFFITAISIITLFITVDFIVKYHKIKKDKLSERLSKNVFQKLFQWKGFEGDTYKTLYDAYEIALKAQADLRQVQINPIETIKNYKRLQDTLKNIELNIRQAEDIVEKLSLMQKQLHTSILRLEAKSIHNENNQTISLLKVYANLDIVKGYKLIYPYFN